MIEQKIPSNPREYPRWITINDRRVLVNDHYHHSAMAGVEYDASAQLVVKEPPKPEATPPKLEEEPPPPGAQGGPADHDGLMPPVQSDDEIAAALFGAKG